MVDTHLHILPGIDDGPATMAEAMLLADALVADGVTIAVATPHVSDRYPNTPAEIVGALGATQTALREAGHALRLTGGAELALERMPALGDGELAELSIGGHDRHVLLECPRSSWPLDFELHTTRLRQLGLTPVIAHPERCAAVQADHAPLLRLVDAGALVQITASSLCGHAGRGARRCARELIDAKAAQIVASDAHGATHRPPRLTAAAAALGNEPLAEWLTEQVPAALADGADPPARPPHTGGARGRGSASRRFRRG